MANEIRVRSNFQAGTITDNPLTNVATTINSAAFASLPVVGVTQHLVLVLDPLATAGAPEIVYVTAHVASATSVTVLRGQEGTVARQHASGVTWRHTPVVSDYDSVLGRATVTTNQTTITTQVDLLNLAATVNVPYAGHLVKITALCVFQNNTANNGALLYIMEGATQLQIAGMITPVANNGFTITTFALVTPTAGSHTYKLQAANQVGGTVLLQASPTNPAYILVEDLGPAL